MDQILFHLAFPVLDLNKTKRFYVDGLGCKMGRSSSSAITLELGGHQIIAHLTQDTIGRQKGIYPRHFGLVFKSEAAWRALIDRAKDKGLIFHQVARCRFQGSLLEHLTFFLEDPSGNLLEFKYYLHESAIFGEDHLSQVGDIEAVD